MSDFLPAEKPDSRSVARLAVVLLLMGAGAWVLSRLLFGSSVRLTPEDLRIWVLSFGWWAPVAYVILYAQPLIPLPFTVMAAAAGLAFGPVWGTSAAVLGATLRACATFAIARVFGLAAIPTAWRARMDRLSHSIGGGAHFRTVLLVRIIPNVPFDLQNYGLGLTGAKFGTYLAGTAIGVMPLSWACAVVGDTLVNPRRLWPFMLAVTLMALAVFLWARFDRKRAQQHA